jgi:hypothetical protein
LLSQLAQRPARGIIHQIHQAALRTSLLKPSVKAPIQLHQFTKMSFARSTLAIPSSFPLSAPQAALQHPSPQSLAVDLQPVFTGQVFGSQRWSETLLDPAAVLVPYKLQYLLPEPLAFGVIASPACSSVLHTCYTFRLITFP